MSSPTPSRSATPPTAAGPLPGRRSPLSPRRAAPARSGSSPARSSSAAGPPTGSSAPTSSRRCTTTGWRATAAASLLAVVGLFDIIGTIGSGWLSDRVDPRILLVVYYALRGTALIALPLFLGPDIDPPLLVIMVFFGLDWVATVPPTAMLCGRIFGPERGPIVFGWVFASHMIGAAVAAAATGMIREAAGDYATAWFLAGAWPCSPRWRAWRSRDRQSTRPRITERADSAGRRGLATIGLPAPVAQWIEQPVSTRSAGGSSPSGRTS